MKQFVIDLVLLLMAIGGYYGFQWHGKRFREPVLAELGDAEKMLEELLKLRREAQDRLQFYRAMHGRDRLIKPLTALEDMADRVEELTTLLRS